MVAIHRDDEPPGVGVRLPHLPQLDMCLRERVGQPLARHIECRAQALRHQPRVEGSVERCRLRAAVGADPLHLAAKTWEVHGAHHAAISQRRPVAVLDIGLGLAPAVVVHKRDGQAVGSKWRARQTQPHSSCRECLSHAVTPRALVTRVVHFVKHGERPGRDVSHGQRRLRHLLVGGDDAVHVGRQRLTDDPRRVEVQAEPLGRRGPLTLQVLRGRHHHQPAPRVRGQILTGRGEGEGGLSRPRRRHREEVIAIASGERVERVLLPLAKTDGSGADCHERGRLVGVRNLCRHDS